MLIDNYLFQDRLEIFDWSLLWYEVLWLLSTCQQDLAWEEASRWTVWVLYLPAHCTIGSSLLFHHPVSCLTAVHPTVENSNVVVWVQHEVSLLKTVLGGLCTNFMTNKVAGRESWLGESPNAAGKAWAISSVTFMLTGLAVRYMSVYPLHTLGDGIGSCNASLGGCD